MFDLWYFHLPNYALAALMYTALGRLVLLAVFPQGSRNPIPRGFEIVTRPVLALVRPLTPAIAPLPLVLVFAAIWLMLARLALVVALIRLSGAPGAQGAA